MIPATQGSQRVMAHTLRRSCPPHTRIARKSASATSSPNSKSQYSTPSGLPSSASSRVTFALPNSSTNSSTSKSFSLPSSYGVASYSQARSFHGNARYLYATKDAQDKDSLKPRATEYSKSGSDDAAAHDDAAFDPSQTRPETEKRSMGESENSTEGNPLSVSPGNAEVSKARDPQEGGAENATGENRKRTSGAGSPRKSGGDKSG